MKWIHVIRPNKWKQNKMHRYNTSSCGFFADLHIVCAFWMIINNDKQNKMMPNLNKKNKKQLTRITNEKKKTLYVYYSLKYLLKSFTKIIYYDLSFWRHDDYRNYPTFSSLINISFLNTVQFEYCQILTNSLSLVFKLIHPTLENTARATDIMYV